MQRWTLHPHPQSPAPAVRAVRARLGAGGDGPTLAFEIDADRSALRWPAPATPAFRDGLWRHCCMEMFAAGTGGGYREFNFSPSSEFAAYGFDTYRNGMRALELPGVPVITWNDGPPHLCIDIRLPAGWLAEARQQAVGLAAVLEHSDGSLSYWALRHPGPKPDFHHRDGFIAGWPPARD
jgi:hypothetical protein